MPWPVPVNAQPGSEVTVAIRPEALAITGPSGEGDLAVGGTIRHVEMLGAETLVHVVAPPLTRALVARVEPSAGARLKVGAAITLAVAPRRVLVFAKDGRRIVARPVSTTAVRTASSEAAHV